MPIPNPFDSTRPFLTRAEIREQRLAFDYGAAWHHVAMPAYLELPEPVRILHADTISVAGDLHQLPDCSMPWPDDPAFKIRFDDLPAEILALASAVIYYSGHWKPSNALSSFLGFLDDETLRVWQDQTGAHWKFSHYADQSLRERLGLPPRGHDYHSGGRAGVFSFAVHEGVIRLGYNATTMWASRDAAPATPAGMDHAIKMRNKARIARDSVADRRHTRQMQNNVWRYFESLDDQPADPDVWGTPLARLKDATHVYLMTQERRR